MAFYPVTLNRPIQVNRVVTVHYFEYSSDYYFEGERHDFWEFLYVDKGELDVLAGDRQLRMTRGQLIFHAPGEFHALRATGTSAPNLVVVSFCCDGPDMSRFEGRVDTAGDVERFNLEEAVRRTDALMADYDGVLARLREKSQQLTRAAGENERLLLEMLERSGT